VNTFFSTWSSPLWQDGFTLFLSIVIQALPFLLLGVMLSGFLEVFVGEQSLMRFLPSNAWGSLAGGVFGFFFPVCECGNLPVARRLVLKGVAPHVAIAFLLAAPVFNPVVILATWTAFQGFPEIVLWRVGSSLVIAVVVAWIFSFQKDWQPLLNPEVQQERCLNTALNPSSRSLLQRGTFWLSQPSNNRLSRSAPEKTPRHSFKDLFSDLLDVWIREVQELSGVLILGAGVATLVQTLIPRTLLLAYGQDPILSILVMLGLAVIVSICSTVDSFFALAFVSTFTPGSLLAFLVFGPMIDLKSISLMTTLFQPKVIIYMTLLTLQFSGLVALCLNIF
jgi:uncharacterized membrane protein YraQ (UPF0718 family)